MKKIIAVFLSVSMLFCCFSCSGSLFAETGKVHEVPNSVKVALGKGYDIKNLLDNDKFEKGICVLPNTLESEVSFAGYLGFNNYNTVDDKIYNSNMMLAQWCSDGNIGDENSKDYSFSYNDNGDFTWKNAYKKIIINPYDGKIVLQANCGEEYGYANKNSKIWTDKKPLDHWVHLLVQPIFPQELLLNEIDNNLCAYIDFSVDYLIDRLEYDKPLVPEAQGEQAPQCAQLVFYMILYSDKYFEYLDKFKNGEITDLNVVRRESAWIGIPLFDNRDIGKPVYDVPAKFDKGSLMYIYNVPKTSYFSEQPSVGERYKLTIPLKNYFDSVMDFISENDVFDGKDISKYKLIFSNFGWEIPGTFDVGATLYQLGIYY